MTATACLGRGVAPSIAAGRRWSTARVGRFGKHATQHSRATRGGLARLRANTSDRVRRIAVEPRVSKHPRLRWSILIDRRLAGILFQRGVAAKRGPELGCSGMGSRRRARRRQSRRVIRRPWSAIMRCSRAQRWHAVPSVLRQRGRARPWFRRGANATMRQWQLVCMVRGVSVFLR